MRAGGGDPPATAPGSVGDAFIANIPTGLAFFDRELRYVRVNRALAAMNGVPAEAHVGKGLRDLFPAAGWAAQVETATAHGGSIEARSADGATTFTLRLPRRASGADS